MIEINPWKKDMLADMLAVPSNGNELAIRGVINTCEKQYSTDSSMNIVPKVSINLQEHTSIEYNLLKDLSKEEENPYLVDIAGLGEDAVSEDVRSYLLLRKRDRML